MAIRSRTTGQFQSRSTKQQNLANTLETYYRVGKRKADAKRAAGKNWSDSEGRHWIRRVNQKRYNAGFIGSMPKSRRVNQKRYNTSNLGTVPRVRRAIP